MSSRSKRAALKPWLATPPDPELPTLEHLMIVKARANRLHHARPAGPPARAQTQVQLRCGARAAVMRKAVEILQARRDGVIPSR